MGCLLEFFVELLAELFFELAGHCYIKLMQMIVPHKIISEKTKTVIKKTVTTVAAVLAVVLIIGVILFVQEDPVIKTIGKYMTYTPLIIMALQITLGILVKTIGHFIKKHKKTGETQ